MANIDDYLKKLVEVQKDSNTKLDKLNDSLSKFVNVAAGAAVVGSTLGGGSGAWRGVSHAGPLGESGIPALSNHVRGTAAEGLSDKDYRKNFEKLRGEVKGDFPGIKFFQLVPKSKTEDLDVFRVVSKDPRMTGNEEYAMPGGHAFYNHKADMATTREQISKQVEDRKRQQQWSDKWKDSWTISNAAAGMIPIALALKSLAPGDGSSGDTLQQYNSKFFAGQDSLSTGAWAISQGYAMSWNGVANWLSSMMKGPR